MNTRNTGIILKREFKNFFTSPTGYLVIGLFLIISGWFFFSSFFLYERADMRGFFSLLPIIFAFTIPAVTMRLFSEEYRSGSFEIIGTMPVSTLDIVVGKSLAALVFVIVMILPTLSYAFFISSIGELDWGPVIGGYIGSILLAGAYVSIGVLSSSFTKNQIVAFIISAAVCLFLSLVDKMLVLIPTGLGNVLQAVSSGYHFTNISRGILDSRDLLYFLSVIFLSLQAAWIFNRDHR
ncbi:MAG: ABC transporter permease subunit [Spirochaetales bacterium]|nr:ABC transporter permease subunit [Spirochaetales bacterium]